MSPDISILFRVLGNWGDEAALTALRPLSVPDWVNLVQESISHQVAPLLHRRLKALETLITPPPLAVAQLRSSYLKNSARGIWFMNGLPWIVEALREENIPVILYKGIYLAGVLYEDVGLRPMVDIDILIHESDYSKVRLCLDKLRQSRPAICPPVDIKTHTAGIASLHNVDTDGIWKRAQSISINGVKAMVLAPEDMFLTLCMHHFFQHAGQLTIGIRAFCDVQAVLDRYRDKMDWAQVAYRADEWGVSNCVSLASRLTRDLLNASMPPELEELAKAHDPGGELQTFAGDYFSARQSESLVLSPYLLQLLAQGRLKRKLSFIMKTAIPNAELMAGKMRTNKYSARFYSGYIKRVGHLVWIGLKMLLMMIVPSTKKWKLIKLIRWMT
jgi:hypothetical protein